MSSTRSTVRADGRGRVLLPKPVRECLHISPGATVHVEVIDDGSVVLRSVRDERRRQLRAAKGSFKGRGGSVDDLIAERRAEAARELRDA